MRPRNLMRVWILEKRNAEGWVYCDVYATPTKAKEEAPSFHPAPSTVRWEDAPQAVHGYFGQASVPAFRLTETIVKV